MEKGPDWAFSLTPEDGVFGSGLHESTRQCLRIIADWFPGEGRAVLCDVGCGTGILALAAAERGFMQIHACDIEKSAVMLCRRNVRDNHLEGRIFVVRSSAAAFKTHMFSHVIANIQGDILLFLADDLCRIVKPGGLVLLAGIAWEWLFEVKCMLKERGFTITLQRMGEEFATLVAVAKDVVVY